MMKCLSVWRSLDLEGMEGMREQNEELESLPHWREGKRAALRSRIYVVD